MIAVGGGHEAPPDPGLQIMLAHQAPDLLVVHDEALLPERSADAATTMIFSFRQHRSNVLGGGQAFRGRTSAVLQA